MNIKNKNLHIETLRGIAILLVVAGHVIGSDFDGGMKIAYPSPWRYLYLWIDYIQMPLFTAIAGWVYVLKPGVGRFSDFIQKKAIRLLIPMITVGTIYFLIQYLVPGTNNKGYLPEIWRIYIFPYTIYWYLPSLFLIFLFVFWCDKYKWAYKLSGWCILLITTLLLYASEKYILPNTIPNLFSFRGALNQLPYFVAGMGIYRFSKQLFTPKLISVYTGLALTGLILLQVEWFYPLHTIPIYECIQPIWIIATLAILIQQPFNNTLFIRIGSYAYSIYLFHGFGTSGGRIILSYFNIHTEIIVFIFAFILAISIPVFIEIIFNKNKIIQLLLLGKSSR